MQASRTGWQSLWLPALGVCYSVLAVSAIRAGFEYNSFTTANTLGVCREHTHPDSFGNFLFVAMPASESICVAAAPCVFFDALVKITLFILNGSLVNVHFGFPCASWRFLVAPRGWLGAMTIQCYSCEVDSPLRTLRVCSCVPVVLR